MNLLDFSNKRICVAVSGGVDSVVLLCYLRERQPECGYSLSAVHCEHGIRGQESLADMRFVEALCKEWNIPLTVFSEDCPARAKKERISLETAARRFRYERFASLVEGDEADLIALAHHFNDEAETVLFRLLRGSSLTGVGGMSALNGYLLRPLLDWTRAEIVEYARKNALFWREDKTNFERDATRNKLRLDVLPLLEQTVPGASGNLVRFASLAREDDGLLYEYAKDLLFVDGEEIAVAFCDKPPLFRRACVLALKALGVTHDYTALHLENAYKLQFLERGARMTMLQGVECEKRENTIVFYKKTPPVQRARGGVETFSIGRYDGGRYLVTVSKAPIENSQRVLRLDGEKLPEGAVFRFREEGDFIERFGGGTKSLKKFFNERKIPVAEREYIPLIARGSEVYAVCGVEISEKVKITPDTKEILYITVEYVDGL